MVAAFLMAAIVALPRRGPCTRHCFRRALSASANPANPAVVSLQPKPAAAQRNADADAVFFVTGANRGIGLEMAKQLLGRTQGVIVGACRSPNDATALQQLVEGNPNRVRIMQLDLTDQASITAMGDRMANDHGRCDLLLNVAGILGDAKTTPGPERSLSAVERDWMLYSIQVNCVGPVMVTQALRALLHTAKTSRAPSVVANVSARVGSIGDNRLGGWWSYRLSKAALNQATRCTALELRRSGGWAVALHPGTTDTALSKPFQANVRPDKLFSVEYTASQLLCVVDGLEAAHSGGFYAYDGTSIPW